MIETEINFTFVKPEPINKTQRFHHATRGAHNSAFRGRNNISIALHQLQIATENAILKCHNYP